jgi:hypothetical protein
MKKLLFITTLLYLLLPLYSQNNTSSVIKEILSNSINKKTSSEQLKTLAQYSLNEVLNGCQEYLNDSILRVRESVYEIVYLTALQKNKEPEITKAVNILLAGCKDKDQGIVFMVLNYLKYFKQSDFNAEARIKLAQLAREGSSYFIQVIRLTGSVGINDLVYDYKEMLQLGKYDKKTLWNLRLALARMGDVESETYCMNRVRKVPLNNDVVYDLFPDLTYLRTKASFDYLLDIIQNNEKNCASSNPDSEAPIICAYEVMRIVAPYINDFPVKIDKTGDFIEKDYNKLLITVRQWIDNNKTTYTLNTQIY